MPNELLVVCKTSEIRTEVILGGNILNLIGVESHPLHTHKDQFRADRNAPGVLVQILWSDAEIMRQLDWKLIE